MLCMSTRYIYTRARVCASRQQKSFMENAMCSLKLRADRAEGRQRAEKRSKIAENGALIGEMNELRRTLYRYVVVNRSCQSIMSIDHVNIS